ncbi:MAG: DUF1585 domain-containing protein, partial [Gemmataceae bacterium]
LKGTLRQQMEQHRANPNCTNCHAKLDPIGFALENFDGIGRWRDKDNNLPIETAGTLPGGIGISGPADLRKVLSHKAAQFRKCLVEKMLTYALGRGTEYDDKCHIDKILQAMSRGQDRFSALVIGIVESDSFQRRQAKREDSK